MNMPVITTLSDCCREVLGKVPPYTAFTGTTDARFFNLCGNTPATCYGPHAETIHGIHAWVSIDSMKQVATVLAARTRGGEGKSVSVRRDPGCRRSNKKKN